MGVVTTNLQIWTPDESDLAKPDVYLATMAQSLEDGTGNRILNLEKNTSILTNLQTSQTFVNGTGQTVQYTVNSIGYNDGMTLSGGKITITIPGLYYFGVNGFVLSSSGSSSGSCKFNIRKNNNIIGSGLALIAPNGATSAGGMSASCVSKCVANDVIDVFATFGGSTAGTLTVNAALPEYNMFSAALIKAT